MRYLVAALAVITLVPMYSAVASLQDGPKQRRVANIAHRGASAYAPEHTFPAWDLALEMGTDYIEQDLQMTADGVLVVLHDNTLDRTARGPVGNCTGPVISKTLEQIKTCDVGTWFNEAYPEQARPAYVGLEIPTLREVFERYGRKVNYYIETKTPALAPMMEEKLLELIDEFGLRGSAVKRWQVLIQSFSPESLMKIHALDPELPLVQLSPVANEESLALAAGYAVGYGPSYKSVTERFVARAHELCLEVHPYTVNSAEDIASMIAAGVDGMFTNHPDRLAEIYRGKPWSGAKSAEVNRRCRA